MTIDKNLEGTKLTLAVAGRLDTTTAPMLSEELEASLDSVEELALDFNDLDYISSAGLRVLLSAQKRMNKQGRMYLTGVNDAIMEVFEVTGFADILTIQ